MRPRRLFIRLIKLGLASLVLAAALLAHLPTTHCHCNDSAPSQKKEHCPFSAMRALVATLSQPEPITVPTAKIQLVLGCLLGLIQELSAAFAHSVQVRAPPFGA